MKIKLIHNINDFKKLKNHWDDIYKKNEYTIFQSFTFNYASWKYDLSISKINKLQIVLILKQDEIISIMPFYLDFKNRLRFINDTHIDYCDILINESIDLNTFYKTLKKSIKFSSIHLINVKKNSNIYKLFKPFNIDNLIIRTNIEFYSLYINSGDFPYNVNHYRSHQKHRINKAFKKHNNKSYRILNVKNDSFPEDEIKKLRDYMIISNIRKHSFLDEKMLNLIHENYYCGNIVLGVMSYLGETKCINIILQNNQNKYMFWIDLFNFEQMINIASYINFIKIVSKHSNVEIDFGRGKYFYKYSNFAPLYDNLFEILIFSSHFQKLRFIIFDKLKNSLKKIYIKLNK